MPSNRFGRDGYKKERGKKKEKKNGKFPDRAKWRNKIFAEDGSRGARIFVIRIAPAPV